MARGICTGMVGSPVVKDQQESEIGQAGRKDWSLVVLVVVGDTPVLMLILVDALEVVHQVVLLLALAVEEANWTVQRDFWEEAESATPKVGTALGADQSDCQQELEGLADHYPVQWVAPQVLPVASGQPQMGPVWQSQYWQI